MRMRTIECYVAASVCTPCQSHAASCGNCLYFLFPPFPLPNHFYFTNFAKPKPSGCCHTKCHLIRWFFSLAAHVLSRHMFSCVYDLWATYINSLKKKSTHPRQTLNIGAKLADSVKEKRENWNPKQTYHISSSLLRDLLPLCCTADNEHNITMFNLSYIENLLN